MKLPGPNKLKDIAAIINCEFEGDPNHIVNGLNEIHMVEEGDIVFVDHPKYYTKALSSKATTILINKKNETKEKHNQASIEIELIVFYKCLIYYSTSKNTA